MKKISRLRNSKFFISIISTWFSFLSLNCNNIETNSIASSNSPINDSILIWIKKGRNIAIPDQERKEFLQKAFSAVNNTSVNDSIKIKHFSKLSLAYLDLNDSENFKNINKRTIKLAKSTNDSIILAESHWDMGLFFSRNAIRDSAYYQYSLAQRIYSTKGNDFYSARMLYNMAVEQFKVRDFTGSEITTIRAIELLKPLNKYKQLYNCYNNLATVSNNLKEYDRALEYHKNALEYLEKLNEKEIRFSTTLNNIGAVYQEKGEQKKAISYFTRVLSQDSLYIHSPELYGRALNNLAYSKFKSGDDSKVEQELKRALKIRISVNDLTGISGSHYNLAEYYFAKKDTITALSHAKQAKANAQESNNNERLLETLQLIAKLDPKNAATHVQEYIVLNDSLQQEERKIRNKFARIRFETDEFIARNELLAKQQQLWIGIAAGLLLLTAAVFVIISQRIKHQKLKFQQQQQETNQEIFNLMLSQNQKKEEGKQSEQKRISEELHDGVLGEMNGIRMVLLGLNKKTDEDAMTMRSKAIEKLQEVQEEIRTISHELNDSSYQKFHNFINSIENLLKSIGDSAQIKCTFTYDHETDWDDLSGDIKINLYRIVQESLQNSIKHSQAQNVSLSFDADDEKLKITLSDDGKGFDPRKAKKGIGHKNIKSRVEKLKGVWKITSKIGKGTKVFVKVPYRTIAQDSKVKTHTKSTLQQV